ncbi:MAG: hypothetical protein M1839_009367 [Geoglossum umbratile]|nr:MAG: hypothetical protein M1839_009367 [Geoglossum umbratile]
MGPDGLQTFTSAVQVVQLAYEIYKFFRNVSAADAQARAVYKKIRRLHEVIRSVDQVLECREQQRGAEPPAQGEGQVEGSIRACHNACYRLLLAMQDEIKDLTRKESLEIAARVWSSLKYTLNSRPKIRELEQSLDTHLQTLRTCLQILQCFEHLRTQNRIESHHNETHSRLDTHHSEVLSRFGRLEHEIARTNTLLGQRNSPQSPSHSGHSNIAVSGDNLEADLAGIQTLQQTLRVAQEVRSTWDPDTESLQRVQRSVSRGDSENDDSSIGDNSDADEMTQAGSLSSPEAGEDERLHLVPDLDSTTPLSILSGFIERFQRDAEREFKAGNFNRAESSQLEAIAHLDEREAKHKIPFSNRPEMQQFLATIYLKQHNFGRARSIMLDLAYQEQPAGSDVLSRARQHHMLAEIYHEMYLADKNLAYLECADKYSRSAFNQLHERAPGDPLLSASIQLLVHILEAQGRTVLADGFRSLISPESPGASIPEEEPPIQVPVLPESPIDVNFPDAQGMTMLLLAIQSLDSAQLQDVLQRDPDIHQRCNNDWTPLMHAVHVGSELAVRRLVDRGADINATATPDKLTALHQAASKGNSDMIELLTALDVEIESRTPDGATPLLTAVSANQISAVSTLLRHHADVLVTDTDGWGVLHHAVHGSAANIIRLLLSQDSRPDVNCRCRDGSTPLHLAAKVTRYAAAEALLDFGADTEAQDFTPKHRTPLYHALNGPPSRQREEFVGLLLDHHAIVDWTRLPSTAKHYDLREPFPLPLSRADSGFFSIARRDSSASALTGASRRSTFSMLGRLRRSRTDAP